MKSLPGRWFVWLLLAATQTGVSAWSATGLLSAAVNNDLKRVVQLVEAGTEVNERGRMGTSPLHWAAFHGNEEMIGLLLDAGARIDVKLENGSTPLHLAAYKGHAKAAQLLRERGADPLVKTLEGITPIAWARYKGHEQVVKLLTASASGVETRLPQPGPVPVSEEPSLPRQETKPEPDLSAQANVPPRAEKRYRVQLVAMSSEESARRKVRQFNDRHPGVLRDVRLLIEPTEGARGRLYRVQSEPLSLPRAKAICEQLKQQNQACLLRGLQPPRP